MSELSTAACGQPAARLLQVNDFPRFACSAGEDRDAAVRHPGDNSEGDQ